MNETKLVHAKGARAPKLLDDPQTGPCLLELLMRDHEEEIKTMQAAVRRMRETLALPIKPPVYRVEPSEKCSGYMGTNRDLALAESRESGYPIWEDRVILGTALPLETK